MLIEGLLNRGSMPVLEQVMNFTEQRHNVLVNNVSNFDTVGYQAQDLPQGEFRKALDRAVERRRAGGAGAPLEMASTRHLQWDRQGRLRARPVEIPDNNILFQDGNNRFVEKQMAALAKNALHHNVAVELLRGQHNLLGMAIRGRF